MSVVVKINKLALPFSAIYGLGVGIRNTLFDWNILPSEEFSVPVISIGNITVGGTGKTPHTEFLISLLSTNKKVAVLSRGYKRKSSGFLLADKNSSSLSLGDEPYQIYLKFPTIIVAVDSNRRRGINNLLNLPQEQRPEIILLDDAFQHRYVTPSLSILLSDYNRPIYDDMLLPAGRLRESQKNKSRANIVIVTKCPQELKPIDYRIISKYMKLYPYQSLFFSSFEYGDLNAVFKETATQKLSLKEVESRETAILLVAGLAKPEGLIKKVGTFTKELDCILFADHHHFRKKDIKNIRNKFEQLKAPNKLIVMSEKDAARWMHMQDQLDEELKKVMYYLPIKVVFNMDQEKIFIEKIEEHVRNIKRNRSLA